MLRTENEVGMPNPVLLGEKTMKRKTGKSKKLLLWALLLLLSAGVLDLCFAEIRAEKLPHRYATAEEGRALLLANTDYYAGYTQNDPDFRMKKSGATLDELLEVSAHVRQGVQLLRKALYGPPHC